MGSVSKHTSILKVCKVKCLIFNDLVTLRTFGSNGLEVVF